MSLLRDLLNTGIQPGDAQILDAHFANEPDFIPGLEAIARVLALNESPQVIPPTGEPWSSIHATMVTAGVAYDVAFNQALQVWDASIQAAITGAIGQRMQELIQWLNQNQNQNKRRKTKDYERILQFLNLNFRLNLCTLQYEVNGKNLTDGLEAEIRMQVRDAGVWEVNVMKDVYTAQAWKNQFHPVRDYLLNLKFNGGDPINDLAGFVQDEHNIFPTLLRHWLIGAVARVLGRGLQNRMFIWEGKKGIGKSDLVRWLGSPLKDYYFEGGIDPDPKNKDYRALLIKTWIWEVNEFSRVTRRSDRDELKAFLTTQQVEVRLPYDRRPIVAPALSSFIGTANNEYGLLSEPDRRFMICHLLTIDWQYIKLDVDQIWAQAVELYLSGEKWEPSPDSLITVNAINDEYQVVDIVRETIQKFFDVDPSSNSWLSTLDILTILKDPAYGNLKPGTEIDTRRLSTALTNMGLDKPKSKRVGNQVIRGYWGIRVLP